MLEGETDIMGATVPPSPWVTVSGLVSRSDASGQTSRYRDMSVVVVQAGFLVKALVKDGKVPRSSATLMLIPPIHSTEARRKVEIREGLGLFLARSLPRGLVAAADSLGEWGAIAL